jgi:hypothetical protein
MLEGGCLVGGAGLRGKEYWVFKVERCTLGSEIGISNPTRGGNSHVPMEVARTCKRSVGSSSTNNGTGPTKS